METPVETNSTCYVCNEVHPDSMNVTIGDHTVCADCKDVYLQAYQEGVPVPRKYPLGRANNILVISPGSELPDRCVQCNAPTAKQKQIFKKLGPANQATGSWRIPLELEVGVCQKCIGKRKLGLLLILFGLAIFVAAIVLLFTMTSTPFMPMIAINGGQYLAILFIVPGLVLRRKLRIIRVKNENLLIAGASKKFLNSLPNLKR